MTISYAIQAHPDRRAWAEDLAGELDAPIAWAEPPYATLHDRRPVWRTKRSALQMHTDAPFHCVLQDDAVLADDFVPRLERLVTAGDYMYMLFFRQKRAYPGINRRARQATDHFIYHRGPVLGVGLVFPTHRIAEMIAACDAEEAFDGDDDRVKRWIADSDLDTYVPLPSLVDHRQGPSLVGNDLPGRVAWKFG